MDHFWTAVLVAFVTAAVAMILPPRLSAGTTIAALAGVAVLFWLWDLISYWRRGYQDEHWAAGHDDTSPDLLLLTLQSLDGAGSLIGTKLECWVRVGGSRWIVIPDGKFRTLGRVDYADYPLHETHQLRPGEDYESRWYMADDHGRFWEKTRHDFQLRVHQQQSA